MSGLQFYMLDAPVASGKTEAAIALVALSIAGIGFTRKKAA